MGTKSLFASPVTKNELVIVIQPFNMLDEEGKCDLVGVAISKSYPLNDFLKGSIPLASSIRALTEELGQT